ncbi:hypothetical protein [Paenibacillus sp. Soil522]|uniref:hypothetical protein n=1 Tax=Paenibacillus sp. Soil522 TaxID=1736388 RepID=UPI0006FB85F1|nr:hypothetical protein [Paenibacillus sp. Soil522]KRE35577.1 hypothetical protein ASG81_20795 [Paenibacillus sp. Soil522]
MDNEPRNDANNPSPNDPYAARPVFSNELAVQEGPKKQSGLGIASFVIGLLSVVLLIIAIVSGSSFVDQIANTDLTIADPSDTAAFQESIEALGEEVLVSVIVAVFCIFGAGLLSLVGLILAIIGAFSGKRRKLFSVIGIVLNVLAFVGGIGLFFAGAAAIAANVAV